VYIYKVYLSLTKLLFLNHLFVYCVRFLHKNKIENMESRVFTNLSHLEQLYLHSNKIQKLDLEMFQGLTKLERL
jgi:Leucine-rich repeat (LRR) protein